MIFKILIVLFIFYLDENDGIIGKPLFSDNDDEDDELIDSEQWRNERFKRESYLSKV